MKILYTLFFVLVFITANASHLLGGYMSYKYISGNTFEIKLTLYRDCNSTTLFDGQAGAQVNAVIGIFNSSAGLYNSYTLDTPQVSVITGDDTLCFLANHPCMEQGVYTLVVNIPSSAAGYTITYERCCFGNMVTNLNDPLNNGVAFTAYIPPSVFMYNTAPVFDSIPSVYSMVNDTINFSSSATDADADSLVYSLCGFYSAGSGPNPAPNPPLGPPYTELAWANGYSSSNLFGTTALTINPQTGWVTGVPTVQGMYVIGICVEEYRNGSLLTTAKRLLTFTVADCYSSMNDIKETGLRLFPNPTTDLLTVELDEELGGALKLTDINGKILQEIKLTEKTTSVSTRHLPAGYYNALITTTEGKTATQRFVKMED